MLRESHEHSPQRADIALQLARCEIEAGRVPEARALLQELVADHPNFAAALVELSKLDLDDGQYEQAAELLSRAVTADPSSDAAWYNLAIARERLGRADEAAEPLAKWNELQQARLRLREQLDRIKSDPADIDARVTAGEICLAIGDAAQALRHFTAALGQNPDHAAALEGMNRLNNLSTAGAADPHATQSGGIRP